MASLGQCVLISAGGSPQFLQSVGSRSLWKVHTHTHWKENQGYEKQEAAGKSITRYFHDLDPEKKNNENKSNFCHPRQENV